MKRIITLTAIISIASFLTGCCCFGPYGYNCAPCGPYGGACDSCPATAATSSDLFTPCGVGGCYGGACGPVCGPVCGPNSCEPCFTGYYGYPCCPLLTIVSLPFRVVEELWMCAVGYWPNTGCSQIYWGEWSDPPCPDQCCFNNYAGPCSSRACGATACRGTIGCNSGCSSCDGGFGYGYGDGMIYEGGMDGEVIMDSAAPTPATRPAPGRPQVIQPTPAPAPGTSTSNCRNCSQNRQAAVQNPTTYRAAKSPNGPIQQIQYQQPVQRTYAPAQPNNVNVPNDIMNQLPPGAVIVSDEVVSAQATIKAGGDSYAPVLPNSSNQWKSAAVKRTAR